MPTMFVGVGTFVCLQHNSKTNDPKVFKLGIGMTLGYHRSDIVWGLKGQRSRIGLELDYRSTMWVECLLVQSINEILLECK